MSAQSKQIYFVKSGAGWLTEFEGDLPVMASSKSLAREFVDFHAAEISARKMREQGFEAHIVPEDTILLEE